MDFPEPVSEARRNCFQPDAFSGPASQLSRSHLRLRDWMGVGVAAGPRMSDTQERSPGISGGEVNFVMSS